MKTRYGVTAYPHDPKRIIFTLNDGKPTSKAHATRIARDFAQGPYGHECRIVRYGSNGSQEILDPDTLQWEPAGAATR